MSEWIPNKWVEKAKHVKDELWERTGWPYLIDAAKGLDLEVKYALRDGSREYCSFLSEHSSEFVKPHPWVLGSNMQVTQIYFPSKSPFENGERTVVPKVVGHLIQVDLEVDKRPVVLQLGNNNNGFYASCSDASSSDGLYIPSRDRMRGPFVNSFHKAWEKLIAASETATIALMMDTALRAVYGRDVVFNLEDLLVSPEHRLPPFRNHLESIISQAAYAQENYNTGRVDFPSSDLNENIIFLLGKFETVQSNGQNIFKMYSPTPNAKK